MNILSAVLILAALLVCAVAWLGVAVKEPVLLALGFYFLALLVDRLSGYIVKPADRG